MSEQSPAASASARSSASSRFTGADPRSFPNDPDAERSVLGAMLLDKETIPSVARVLKPEDFFEARHQTIFRHVLDLHEANKPADLTLLCDALKRKGELEGVGGYMYVAQLADHIAGSSAAPEHARVVAEKATLRRLMAVADSILRDASTEAADIQEQLDNAERLVFEVGHHIQTGRFLRVGEVMTDTLQEILRLRDTGQTAHMVRTHMRDLDTLIGGFERSALVILAARPSIGKTAFALNLVRNIAVNDGRPVGFFSLEMGADQLNLRLLCTEAQISSHRVRHGRLGDEQWDRIRETATRMMQVPIFIDDSPALTLMQLRSRARRLKAQNPTLSLIVVDYLQLMRPPDRKGRRESNRQQEVAEVSMGLKALAKELDVPVLALSQLSRSIEQRSTKREPARPQLSDLRESGAIEQDADLVLFIHRERLEVRKTEEGAKGNERPSAIPTEIIVGKNRNGPIGKVDMLFFPDTTRFGDPLIR